MKFPPEIEQEIWKVLRSCEERIQKSVEGRPDSDGIQVYGVEVDGVLRILMNMPLVSRRIYRWDMEAVEIMRDIRNSGRESYSNDHNEISREQQKVWWEKNKDTAVAYLYCDAVTMKPLGYGILIKRDGKYWSSIGFLPECRGKGYGKVVFRHLINMIPGDVWATSLKSNPGGCKIHIPEDWEMWKDDGTYLHYHTWKGRK